MQKLRVAINAVNFWAWGGGIDLVRILVNSLASKWMRCSLEVFVFFPVRTVYPNYNKYLQSLISSFRCYRYSLERQFLSSDVNFMLDALSSVDGQIQTIFCNQGDVDTVFKKLQIDVVLPVFPSLGIKQYSIPQIGYLFDFQHEYFPNFFTQNEISERRNIGRYMLNNFEAIMVNAFEVKKDIGKFFPGHKCKIFNLPFAAAPISHWFEDFDTQALSRQYNLPQKYFMISNQFWTHKSHATAFRALAQYSENKMHLICTGKMQDYRDEGYMSFLKKEINFLGLNDRIHFLGYIPKRDQIRIMRGACAVLQPTLFEGGPGGGAVYDAIALGVPAIVSDIPVNLELDSKLVTYFKAGSADDLLIKMEHLSSSNYTRYSKEELIQMGVCRTERLANVLLEAIYYVIE